MRTLLKVTIPVEQGNAAIRDGSLPAVLERTFAAIEPEAAYFLADHGNRTALLVFDMQDPSQIPAIAEPFFMELNAAVEFSPVMNAEDLRRGLEATSQGERRVAAPPIAPATS